MHLKICLHLDYCLLGYTDISEVDTTSITRAMLNACVCYQYFKNTLM